MLLRIFNSVMEFLTCALASAKGYLIIVITNQLGIGQVYYSEEFQYLNDWMCEQFKENKTEITKVYYSPYHPIHGVGEYKKDDFLENQILECCSKLK